LIICVQERMAAPQYSSHTEGMVSPRSSRRAFSPALGKESERFHIFLNIFSTTESIFRMAVGERAMRQWVCVIFECVPYRRRRYFIWGGKGMFPSAFPICRSCAFVQWRCASGERDAVRDGPRYPPGRGSSWVKEPMVRPARVTRASELGS
jgi:hypothetical protein